MEVEFRSPSHTAPAAAPQQEGAPAPAEEEAHQGSPPREDHPHLHPPPPGAEHHHPIDETSPADNIGIPSSEGARHSEEEEAAAAASTSGHPQQPSSSSTSTSSSHPTHQEREEEDSTPPPADPHSSPSSSPSDHHPHLLSGHYAQQQPQPATDEAASEFLSFHTLLQPPSSSSSSSSSSQDTTHAHPLLASSSPPSSSSTDTQMASRSGGSGVGEVAVMAPTPAHQPPQQHRPASPPLDVVAPIRRRLEDERHRELASSDIVEEGSPSSPPSSFAALASREDKQRQQRQQHQQQPNHRHTMAHLPRSPLHPSQASPDMVQAGADAKDTDGGVQTRQRSYSLSDPHKKNDGDHYFTPTSFPRTTSCNVCRKPLRGLTKQGLSCSICQYIVHYNCEAEADRCCPITYSQPSSLEKMRQMEHAWIEGNVEAATPCVVCKKEILALNPMAASHCFWCGGCAHNGCKENTPKCDMGPHKNFKLPPYAVFKQTTASGEEKWVIEPSLLPEDCMPYLVFVNKKAGGQQGKIVFRTMLSLFNPQQVFDLSKGGPMPGLRMFYPLARRGRGFRIMVCGGDGTVNWVCQTLARVKFPRPDMAPPIVLLPLGTGNDLSGYLGWGVGYTGEDLRDYLWQLHDNNVETVKLDRWKATIANFGPVERENSDPGLTPIDAPPPKNVKKLNTSTSTSSISSIMSSLWTSTDSLQGSPHPQTNRKQLVQDDSEQGDQEELEQNQDVDDLPMEKEASQDDDIELEEEEETVSGVEIKSFHHSFSIGVDAKITWNFHLAREANPDNFTSRGMNKFKYFTQGVTSIIDGGCKNLAQAIEFVEVDGHVIWSEDLPQGIESLIFGNIPAYADGTDLWAKPTGDFKPQRVDDKVVEVIAHKGSIHLVQIKAGVSRAYQLGQGKRIKLQTRDVIPMQLDGEPWLQGPALIQIEHRNQVSMIVPRNRKSKTAA